MPDEKKAVTYLCPKNPSYVAHCTGENGKRVQVMFVNGAYTTDNPSVQKFIEGLHNFTIGVIAVKDAAAIAADAAAHEERVAALAPHVEQAKKDAAAKVAAAEETAAANRASALAHAEAEAKRQKEHDRIVSGIVAKEAADRLAAEAAAAEQEAAKAAKVAAAKKALQDAEDEKLLQAHEAQLAADEKSKAEARAKAEADAATAAVEKPAGDGAAQP